MNTNDYIKELKSSLSELDTKKRDDIIQEIQSYIWEKNASYDTLVQNFGTAKDLATSYLEDMPIKNSLAKKTWSKTKKVLVVLGSIFVLIFIIVAYIIYTYTKDPFDYSKYNANTINTQIKGEWKVLTDIKSINIEQAKVVFYWTKEDNIKYNCKRSNNLKKDTSLNIKQSVCYIKIPHKEINIKAFQSSITLIKPEANINLNIQQTKIRIAEKGNNYTYKIQSNDSFINDLKSSENGILIKGTMYQSKLRKYDAD